MTRYIERGCPSCRRNLRVRAEYAGRSVACNFCDQVFAIGLEEDPQAGSPTPAGADQPPAPVSWGERTIAGRVGEDNGAGVPSDLAFLALKAEVARARGELDSLRLSSDQRIQSLEGDLRDAGAERDRLRQRVEDLQTRLQATSASADAYRAELDFLGNDLRDASAERDRLHAEVEELRPRLEAAAAIADAVDQCRAELDSVRAERGAWIDERRALLLRCEETEADLERARESLRSAAVAHESQRCELVRSLEDDRGRWQGERRTLEAQLEELRGVAGARQRDLEDASRRIEALESRCEDLLARCERTEADARDQRERTEADARDRCERAEADARDRVDEWRERYSRLHAAGEEANQRHQAELRRLEGESDRTRDELKGACLRIVELEQCLQAVEAVLEERSREHARAREGWLRELADEQRKSRESGQRWGLEAEVLRGEAESARVARDDALALVASLRREREDLVTAQETRESRFREAEARLRGQVEEQAGALAEARRLRDVAEKWAEEVTQQLAQLQEDLLRERSRGDSAAKTDARSDGDSPLTPEPERVEPELVMSDSPGLGDARTATHRVPPHGSSIGNGDPSRGAAEPPGHEDRAGQNPGWDAAFDPGRARATAQFLNDRDVAELAAVTDLAEARRRIEWLARWLVASMASGARPKACSTQAQPAPRWLHMTETSDGTYRTRGRADQPREEPDYAWSIELSRRLREFHRRRGSR